MDLSDVGSDSDDSEGGGGRRTGQTARNMKTRLVRDRSRDLCEVDVLRYARYVGKRMIDIGYKIATHAHNEYSNSNSRDRTGTGGSGSGSGSGMNANHELITIVDNILYTSVKRISGVDSNSNGNSNNSKRNGSEGVGIYSAGAGLW